VDDVIARRQCDVRRRVAVLAQHLEGAGLVRTVGEDTPDQPAIDPRQILAVARRQRQHALGRRCRDGRRRRDARIRSRRDGRHGRRRRSLRQRRWRRPCSGPGRRRQAEGRAGVRHRGRRHRRRAITEQLRVGWHNRQRPEQHRQREHRQQLSAAPVKPADATPRHHRAAFHRKRGEFKPRRVRTARKRRFRPDLVTSLCEKPDHSDRTSQGPRHGLQGFRIGGVSYAFPLAQTA
jgi:preprotein translocase subunit Sec61beta